MGEIIRFVKENWAVIEASPSPFIITALIFVAFGFLIGRFAFSERIANLLSRLEMRDDHIDALSARLLQNEKVPPISLEVSAKPDVVERVTPMLGPPKPLAAENVNKKPTSLRDLLIGREWTLYFGGPSAGKKLITFLADGMVGEGRNNNEYRWAVEGAWSDVLVIYRSDGATVQNVFYYSEKYGKFEYLPDFRSRGNKNQSIEPGKR